MLTILLYLIALILLILAAIGVPTRISPGWLALALWLFAEHILGSSI